MQALRPFPHSDIRTVGNIILTPTERCGKKICLRINSYDKIIEVYAWVKKITAKNMTMAKTPLF
jgi:hypothetical protein